MNFFPTSYPKFYQAGVLMKIIYVVVLYIFLIGCESQSQSMEKKKMDAVNLNTEGVNFLISNEFEKAREKFLKAASLDPSSPEYPNNVGVSFLNEGKFEQALIHFTKAVEIEPNYVRGYYNLGVCNQRLGKNEKAIDYYTKVLSYVPNNVESMFNLGIVYSRVGNKDMAKKSYQKFIELAPADKMSVQINDAKQKIAELGK